MPRATADETISRRSIGGFEFPLGVYPVEKMTPIEGYCSEYEPSDSDETHPDIESWPDRYVYDIVVRSSRLESLWMQVLSRMPGRLYPILDYIGHDAYREIDPYIAYEPIGQERIINMLGRYRDFFFEDGMVGFGAVSEDPFFYAFVDEHKILTIRVEPEMTETIERLLDAFGLESVPEPSGADAAAHEHRTVLLAPEDRPELLNADEIVEAVRDDWNLILNIDPDTNLDDDGNDLGITPWRCLLRCERSDDPYPRYAEVILTASSLRDAEMISLDAIDTESDSKGEDPTLTELILVSADRLDPKDVSLQQEGSKTSKVLPKKYLQASAVLSTRWLTPPKDK